MDEIAARARITKRTLYLYFRSKDDLLASTLVHYSELDRKRLQVIADRLPPDADQMLESFFGQLLEWAGKPLVRPRVHPSCRGTSGPPGSPRPSDSETR